MEAPVTFDGFLASLGAGNADSSGAFTISEAAARDKLARFSLVHPCFYVLELLSAAVLGGATVFEVRTQGAVTHFRFDGIPLSGQDCLLSLSHLFESSGDPRLSCLGLGLTVAYSQSGGDMRLSLSDATYAFDGHTLRAIGPPGYPGACEIWVAGRFGVALGLVNQRMSLEGVLELAGCAPLRVSLDGRTIGGSWKPHQHYDSAAMLHWQHSGHELAWGSHPVLPTRVSRSPGDFAAMLVLLPPQAAAKNGVTVVVQGVAYRLHDPSIDLPGASAVVLTDRLKRNVSRSEIVRDSAYREMLEMLEDGLQSLCIEAVRSPYRFTRKMRAAAPAFRWAAARRKQTGSEHPQLASWLAVEAMCQDGVSPSALADLASKRQTRGQTQEGENLRYLAVELIIDRLRQPGSSRDLANHLRLWTPLLRSLLACLSESPRQASLQAFLALIDPGALSQQADIGQLILHHRTLGQPQLAIELLPRWTEPRHEFDSRVPAELWLAFPRTHQALGAMLALLGCASVDEVLAKPWPESRGRDLDLLGDILEYREDPRAFALREHCLSCTASPEMRYLRVVELSRLGRAKAKVSTWVKYRALCSYLELSLMSEVLKTLDSEMPDVKAVLEGKKALPANFDEFLLPLCDKLGTLSGMFAYLLARLAHRLRLAGQNGPADQMLARGYTLMAMDHALYGL